MRLVKNIITLQKKNYIKAKFDGLKKIPAYKQLFKPNEFYLNSKKKLFGVWEKYVTALNKIGINDENIGIFGSYLIGFDITKDVDFVIYGYDNLEKYYKNRDFIREYTNSTTISQKHIDYQYNKHKIYYSDKTDLLEIISRNWSGIQIEDGVLSTPRFVERNNQHMSVPTGKTKVVRLEVLDGLGSSMLPRKCKVLYNNQEYLLMTCIWKYQSFLRKGDIIECLCDINDDLKVLILSDVNYYIKFIKKGNSII